MARSFNGSSQYATTPSANALGSSLALLTISIWGKKHTNDTVDILISHGPDGNDAYWGIKAPYFGVTSYDVGPWSGSGHLAGSAAIADTNWHHWLMRYDGAEVAGFLDGVADGTQATSTDYVPGNDVTYLAYHDATGFEYYGDEDLAEVGVWSRPLSDAEIEWLAAGNAPSTIPDGLVAYWPLFGNRSPEPEEIAGRVFTLVDAPIPSAHPPIAYPAPVDKRFRVRVSDPDGDLIGVWGDVVTYPIFRWPINSGPQSMQITLPRAWGGAGERGESGSNANLALGNQVSVEVDDGDDSGLQVYSASVEEYSIPEPASDGVKVTLVPKTSRFQDRMIRGPLTLTDYDPADMLHYLIDPSSYSGSEGSYLPGITWAVANSTVGVTYSQTFEKMRVSQALEIIRRLAGSKWFFRLNPDNSLTFKEWNLKAAADHTIRSKAFTQVNYVRSRSNVKKRIYVFGADEKRDDEGLLIQERIEAVATAPGYDAEDDPRDDFFTDSRIVDYATALRVARSRLEFAQDDAIETEIEIPDNSRDPSYGYDIETLKPGDTLRILDPSNVYARTKWGGFEWAAAPWAGVWAALVQRPLVIAEVQYNFYSARVKLTNRPASVIEELLAVGERQLLEGSA